LLFLCVFLWRNETRSMTQKVHEIGNCGI